MFGLKSAVKTTAPAKVSNRRAIFFKFLTNLAEEFDTLQRRHRFATLSDEGFSTLQMALVHTAREAQQYQLSILYQAAVNLEVSIRDVQSDSKTTEARFDLKRSFDEFTKESRRSILREEERLTNSGISPEDEVEPIVLVIDKDHWSHKLIDRAIGKRCIVISAYNGNAALETLKTMRPHLVVMDMDLPDIEGSVLLEKLKSNAEISNVPVVVATNNTDDSTVVSGLVGGAIDVIPKGASLASIRDRLLETLDHGRQRLA